MNTAFIKPGFLFITIAIVLSACNTKQGKIKSANPINKTVPDKSKYDSTVFEPVFNKLNKGEALSKSEIDFFSKDISTRADFYYLLAEFKKEDLFFHKNIIRLKKQQKVL